MVNGIDKYTRRLNSIGDVVSNVSSKGCAPICNGDFWQLTRENKKIMSIII